MPFDYKTTLVIGATSGIGWALAAKMVKNGINVIAVGRRKEKLDDFAKQYGNASKASVDTVVFDITKLEEIPAFTKGVFTKHPDLDCVMINSGIQRRLSWTEPEKVDLDTLESELLVNYRSYMHLTKAFLPYLQKKAPQPTSLVFTTSGLGLIPPSFCPNYGATKAALHHMILVMRLQLKDAKSNVKIIEILPPAVQTELHNVEFGKNGEHMGMPLTDFVDEAWAGLSAEENEQVPVQAVKTTLGFYSWEQERQKIMMKMNEATKRIMH